MPVSRVLLVVAAVGLGLLAEAAGPGWDDPLLWLPDLLVGWTLLAAAMLAWWVRGSAAVASLLAATGVAWFVGLTPETLYWHRGPLVHLLLTFPGWRPRSRMAAVSVAVGYVAALVPAVWADPGAAVALSAGLVAVAAAQARRAAPVQRSASRTALVAAAVLAVAVVAASVLPSRLGVAAVLPSLLAYEAAVAGVAALLLVGLARRSPDALADAVVDLADQPAGSLQRRIASAVGDPTVELAFWSPPTREYRSGSGQLVDPAAPGPGRSALVVDREGRPFAVLVHDEQSMRDPRLVDAVARAVLLSDTNATLRTQVDEVYWQVFESRRRLVLAADDERRDLDRRLRDGPLRQLERLDHALEGLEGSGAGSVGRAREHCQEAVADLGRLSNGLRPRDLDTGLLDATRAAAGRVPDDVPVRVEADSVPPLLPADVETTAYFVVAEALANVAKHAHARQVVVEVSGTATALRVSVRDDGVGGADAGSGTGLQGLADRVAAGGGTLEVDSPRGVGTAVVATLPLAGEA